MNDHVLAAQLACEWVEKMRADAELFALTGCLENLLPLEDGIDAQSHVLFYGQLANHDSREWRRLLDCLRLDNMPELVAFQRPSRQSAQVMGKSVSKQSASVLDLLKPEDEAGIQRVLDLFEVTFYHTVSLPAPDQLLNSRPWNAN